MEINKYNYEIFFIDYLEGTLSDSQRAEVESFLLSNPDLQEEFECLSIATLQPDTNICFTNKSVLKKDTAIENIIATDFEQRCVAMLEGDMNFEEEMQFETELKHNPHKQNEFELFKQTILHPILTVVFSHKESLKKTARLPLFVRTLYTLTSMAAALFIVWFLLNTNIDKPKNELATNDSLYNFFQISDSTIQINNLDYTILDTLYHFFQPEDTTRPQHTTETELALLTNDSLSNFFQNLNNSEDTIKIASKNNDNFIEMLPRTAIQIPLVTPLNTAELQLAQQQSILTTPQLQIESSTAEQYVSDANKFRIPSNGEEARQMVEKNVKERVLGIDEESKVTFWVIAEAGVEGFARLTGARIELNNEYDENGKLDVFALSTPRFQITTDRLSQ